MSAGASSIDALSVAAPAYNEAEGIEAFVAGWLAHPRARRLDAFEIVVCDDGSKDGTGRVLAQLAATHPEVRVVSHAINRGGGVAMASAIAATRHSWVLLTDADGQFPPDALDAFEAALASTGARAFLGARRTKRDSLAARAGSAASTALLNRVYGTSYRDFTSACQLVAGPLVRSLTLEASGLNYSLEIVARLLERGVAPVEVEIGHLPRASGRAAGALARRAVERASFAVYLALRRALLRRGVLRGPSG